MAEPAPAAVGGLTLRYGFTREDLRSLVLALKGLGGCYRAAAKRLEASRGTGNTLSAGWLREAERLSALAAKVELSMPSPVDARDPQCRVAFIEAARLPEGVVIIP